MPRPSLRKEPIAGVSWDERTCDEEPRSRPEPGDGQQDDGRAPHPGLPGPGGADPLTGAPTPYPDSALKELGIRLLDPQPE